MATPLAQGPDAIVAKLHEAARNVAGAGGLSAATAIGVASPGPLNTRTGMALGVPTLPGFVDYPIGEKLHRIFGRPVALANDGVAAAVGEWRFGAGRGCADFVYVTISTGIGGGVISDGKILSGRNGMAAHLGHMAIARDGQVCNCGRRGCWEAYAAGPAFERRAATALAAHHTAAQVFELARGGQAVAQALVDQEAEFLGLGIVNLLHIFDPERVILGGGMSHQYAQLSHGIDRVIHSCAMPAFRDIPVLRAEHIGNSGLLGAAALATL
jgi:glucokinase